MEENWTKTFTKLKTLTGEEKEAKDEKLNHMRENTLGNPIASI